MKNIILYSFLLITLTSHSQIREGYKPLSAMNPVEKEMYEILKKCALKKSENPKDVHFFSEYAVVENNDYLDFKSFIYDQPNYKNCDFIVNSATYAISLRFYKIKATYGTGSAGGEKRGDPEPDPTYYLTVTEPTLSNREQLLGYKIPKLILTINAKKPFFENKYEKIHFIKSSSSNYIDHSIYTKAINPPTYINGAFAITQKNDLYGVTDRKNKIIIPFEYEQLNLTRWGFLVKKSKSYFFMANDTTKISKVYEKIDYQFGCYELRLKPYLLVKQNGLYNLIDSTFTEKFTKGYQTLNLLTKIPFEMLATKDNKKVIIDAETWSETSFIYDDIICIDRELLQVEQHKKFGLMKIDKTVLLPIAYDEIKLSTDNFPELFFIVKRNDKYGLVNKLGKLVTKAEYDSIAFINQLKIFEGKIGDKVFKFDSDGTPVK